MTTEQENKKGNNLVFILIILALLGVIGYLVFSNMKKTDTIAEKEEEVKLSQDSLSSKVKELEELQLQYHSLEAQAKELGISKDSLTAKIAELDDAIKKLKSGNAVNMKKLNAQIDGYKKELMVKEEEIVQLRKERDAAIASNDTLKQEKAVMKDSIVALETVRTDLQQKYELASVLRADNITVTVINLKGKELSEDEYKVKSIDNLKVSFTLGDNKVAPKSKKVIYLQVVEPNGATLFDSSTGGGFFKTSEGKEIAFTAKQTIDFTNTKQPVTFVYKKGSEYKVGTYTIKIWQDGNFIGETTMVVK